MRAVPDKDTLASLWDEAERSFVAALQTVAPGKRLVIGAEPPGRGKTRAWRATLDQEPASDGALEGAGLALARLAQALPLIHKPRDGIVEFLRAMSPAGEFWVSIESALEDAYVRLLVRSSDVSDFVASRRWRGRPRTLWDAACRRRLVRKDPCGTVCVIEPGAVWFVEWLESIGAETMYSCEGHPCNFHVVFRGPYELAHGLAGVSDAIVEVFRSGAFPAAGQWCLRLRQDPDSRKTRDDYLRQLADQLTTISPAFESSHKSIDEQDALA